jgi:hypothetical protein
MEGVPSFCNVMFLVVHMIKLLVLKNEGLYIANTEQWVYQVPGLNHYNSSTYENIHYMKKVHWWRPRAIHNIQ